MWLWLSLLIKFAKCDSEYGLTCNETPFIGAHAVAAAGALALVIGDFVLLSERRELARRLSDGLFAAAAIAFVVWLALVIGGLGQ